MFVLGHPRPVEERDGIFELGIGVVGGGGGGEQPRCLDHVFRYAAAFLVQGRERVLGFRTSDLRGAAEERGGARKILRK